MTHIAVWASAAPPDKARVCPGPVTNGQFQEGLSQRQGHHAVAVIAL